MITVAPEGRDNRSAGLEVRDNKASLAPEAARARLAAIGYRDPSGALRHIAALTEGVSRRAAERTPSVVSPARTVTRVCGLCGFGAHTTVA